MACFRGELGYGVENKAILEFCGQRNYHKTESQYQIKEENILHFMRCGKIRCNWGFIFM